MLSYCIKDWDDVCILSDIYIYNSEGVANYWVEKKQSLSSSTRLFIREWKIILQIYNKNNRQFDICIYIYIHIYLYIYVCIK